MVDFGQYPLVYQLRNGIPVGLAESSSVGYLSSVNLVVSSISATVYQGLDITGSFSFTGIQNIDSTGIGGGDLIFTSTGNSVTLRKITITNGFLQATSTGVDDPNVTIQYGPIPLPFANGGTNNNDTPAADGVAYWKDDGFGATRLYTDGAFTFINDKLSLPTGGQYQINGSQIAISDLKDIPAPTVGNTFLQYVGPGNYQWTGVTGTGGTGTTITIPATPGRVLISVDSTSVTSDPQLTYNSGNDTLNTYAINNVCDVCAIRFNEGGLLLVDKYVSKSTTGSFALTSTLRDLAYVSQVDLQATSVTGVAQVSKGGTGLSVLTPGTFLVGNGTAVSLQPTASFETTSNAAVTYLPKALVGQLAYKDQVDLQATSVTGVLQVTKGGLGRSTTTTNRILVGGAANTVTEIDTPSTGYLRWTGTTFAWESPTGTVTLPTDPCAVVFMNATGTGLTSNAGIRVNTASPCATLEIFSNAADGYGGLDLAPDVANEGFVRWNHDYDTLAIAGIGGTSISLGVDEIIPVVNKTGQQIKKGQVAWVSGADSAGLRGEISLLSTGNQDPFVLGVALHAINNNDTGYLIKKGLIKNVTDSDVIIAGDIPSISVGDYLYVSPTAGKMTRTPPSAGVHAATIAIVLDVNGTNISYGVSIEKGYDLGDLHDVQATPTNDGETLVWNTGGYYTTGTLNQITGTLSVTKGGTGLTALTAGSFLVGNGTSISFIPTGSLETTAHAVTTYLDKITYNSFTATLGDLAFIDQVNLEATSTTGTLPLTKGGLGTTGLGSGYEILYVANGGNSVTRGGYFDGTNLLLLTPGQTIGAPKIITQLLQVTSINLESPLSHNIRVDLATTSVTGSLTVQNGGTGLTNLTAGSFLVGNGTTVVLQPTSTFETTGYSRANYATIVSLNSYVPTSTYVAFTGTLRDLAYKPQVDLQTTSVTGVLSVTKGGTGLATLEAGSFLVGNGTTVTLQPTASFETTGYSRANYATIASLNSYVPTSTYVAFTGTLRDLAYKPQVDLETTSVTGVAQVSKGGTGLATLTAGSFLVGNGTTVTLQPTASFETTSHAAATYLPNTAELNDLSDVEVTSTPGDGQVLKYTSGKWRPGTDNTGGGSTTPGGNSTHVQFNNEGSFAGNPGLTFDLTTSTLRAQNWSNLPSGSPYWNANQLSGIPLVSALAGGNAPTNGNTLIYLDGGGYSPGWYYDTAGGGSPGGSTTQIQFNNTGSFSGSPALTWDNSTSTLVSKQLSATTYLNLPSGTATWNANKIQGIPVTITSDTEYDILLSNGSNFGYVNFNLLTLAGNAAAGWNAAQIQGTFVSSTPPTRNNQLLAYNTSVSQWTAGLAVSSGSGAPTGGVDGDIYIQYFASGDIPCEIGVACSDETTNLTSGTAKATFRMPYTMYLTEVRANVNTAPVGSTIIVDIHKNGSTILSTKVSIDASEKTSKTAASAAVISSSTLTDDDEITVNIDQVGSSTAGKGLKIWLIGTRA